MAPDFSPEEKADLVHVIREWLGNNDIHDNGPDEFDTPEDWGNFRRMYARVGKLYYVLTAQDYLCSHGLISNYSGRS